MAMTVRNAKPVAREQGRGPGVIFAGRPRVSPGARAAAAYRRLCVE